jgi:hypothetical protein
VAIQNQVVEVSKMQVVYELAPVIGDVIAAHCPDTAARQTFMRSVFRGEWAEARSMVEGMLAEPWVLRGYQQARLQEFLDLLPGPMQSPPRPPSLNPALAPRSGCSWAQRNAE